ncbi:hypothetical protein ABPG72_003426 [Tetrahymena utriculariae]
MSCQLEVLQTCVSAFMMGLINHKQIPKKLAKKCKVFDYLCKKFPLDQSQLENYSKLIAFNRNAEVEKKFIQDNLLDILIFNKCVSIDSSVQLSNSGSTTLLDSSAECISPYMLRVKSNMLSANPSANTLLKGEQILMNIPIVKSITNIQDQSCSSSGGILSSNSGSGQSSNQLNSTAPAQTIQFESSSKAENQSKPPLPNSNQNYAIGNMQSTQGNQYNLGIDMKSQNNGKNANATTSLEPPNKKVPLINLQSPTLNTNSYQIPQTQRHYTLQTPTSVNTKPTFPSQEEIKVNQFTLGSNNKPVVSNNNNNNKQASNNINNNNKQQHLSNKQASNQFYFPLCIKPINFNMTISNNKDYTQNYLENSTSQGKNNTSLNNYKLNYQFNNTIYNLSQQDLIIKSNPQIERANNFNPSNLLSKVRSNLAIFKEETEKIVALIESSGVTESHITPNIIQSQKAQQNNNNNKINTNININVNNKPIQYQNTHLNANYYQTNKGICYFTDMKRKSYMLKNMSIYQQNNAAFKKTNV